MGHFYLGALTVLDCASKRNNFQVHYVIYWCRRAVDSRTAVPQGCATVLMTQYEQADEEDSTISLDKLTF